MVGNFVHFGNVVIFRELGVSWSGFLRTTTQIWFLNCFPHVFDNFNFLAKVMILQGL